MILQYIAALVVLLGLDALWLGVIAKSFYANELGHLFRSSPLWLPIALFYILYAVAIIYFAVPTSGSLLKGALLGAALGFTAYMTYDLVNYATIKDWPLTVVLVDMLWGTFITMCAALVATWITRF